MEINTLLRSYKGKRVLITGHTGFKGSWLSIWLNKLGAEVIGVSLEPKTESDNYVLAKVHSFVKDISMDIRDKSKINKIFKEEKPEIVFHLAAQALVFDSYKSPLETFEINTMGTANILEAIRITKSVKTAIFITTDKVYTNKEWIWPYREDERLGGYDPYSASKGASELIISSYRDAFFNPNEYSEHEKSVASVRAGNVIGGGDWSENRLIPDCIKALEQENSIEVRSPKSVRPWQHVLEPLGGYLLLGAEMMADPIKFSEAWNFGPKTENSISVSSLVEMLINEYGTGSWNDLSNFNTPHEARLLTLDINKAKYQLGWEPSLSIEETIKFTIDWYKQYKTENMLELCLHQIDEYLQIWKLLNAN